MCTLFTVMVSIFNSAECSYFLTGIMAQRGPAFLNRLKQIKEAREIVVVETSAPDTTSFPKQAPPPPESEKRKRKEKREKAKDEKKEKEKKASSSQHSPKRSRLSVPEASKDAVETDKGLIDALFATNLTFAKGTSVSLLTAKNKALVGSSTINLVNTCLEMQSRALAITKVVRVHVLKGGVAEQAKIKEELSISNNSLKEARDANVALGEALRTAEFNLKKVEQERDALRVYSKGMKKANEKLSADVHELEQSLSEATLTHDDAVSDKAQVEIELNELKDYIIDLHKESFSQAVRQAVFIYGVPEQNEMDPDKDIHKDIFNGRLVPIKEIPTADEDAAPNQGEGGEP